MNPLARRACCAVLALAPALASADRGSGTNAASADLDFRIDIGKFLFFRVGSGAYPTASTTVDTVTLNTAPNIPPGAVVPVPGNSTTVNWDGTLPIPANSASVPVEVRSNAGQVTIRATVVQPLTSGANTIPMSQIVMGTSDPALPAPVLPNTLTGPAVNVAGTAFSNLVTLRSATWSFSYSPAPGQPAGNYTGQVRFTASSP
ncbi:hypothetical protein [Ramlibacter pallidus]|uniref:Uncharacterized protein n=1 Tax=Ramlibacter pallidus TaxID=2780087 RepID=A0ABR9S1C6_9BURK|nr:hypothetical protein [Ramlibacter pallidus]MBE7367291.1 hypothetical protein [Ramlibacter pallidus]